LKYIFSTRDFLRGGCVHEIMAKKTSDSIAENPDQYPLCPVTVTEKVLLSVVNYRYTYRFYFVINIFLLHGIYQGGGKTNY
jgi:hypothetical protein